MLTNEQIKAHAEKAAVVAHSVLGLSRPYTVVLINEPEITEDARFDTTKNEIQINLSLLQPFPKEVVPIDDEDADPLIAENFRHWLKVCYLVFHEMRHMYQKEAVHIYSVNQIMGGHSIPPLESDKKCALWLKEMQGEGRGPEVEADADDFAYYLTCRYPMTIPMAKTNRRLGAMKRKYDKVQLPGN